MRIWILSFLMFSGIVTGFGQDSGTRTQDQWIDGRWTYKAEITGSFGWAALYHGNRRQFSGLNASAGFGLRPFSGTFSGLGFEARFGYLNSNVDTSSDVVILSGNAVYHFSSSKVQPYVLGGLGVLRGERTVVVLIGSGPDFFEEERYNENWNKVGIEFGAGIKVALAPNLSLRPEFRLLDTTAGEGPNLGVPQLILGVSYHW